MKKQNLKYKNRRIILSGELDFYYFRELDSYFNEMGFTIRDTLPYPHEVLSEDDKYWLVMGRKDCEFRIDAHRTVYTSHDYPGLALIREGDLRYSFSGPYNGIARNVIVSVVECEFKPDTNGLEKLVIGKIRSKKISATPNYLG